MKDDVKAKTETFSAQIPRGLGNQFKASVPEGFKIGHCLADTIRLWLDLGEDLQKLLLTGRLEQSLVEIVRKIVDDRIAAGEAAGRALGERLRRKPDRRD